jgi:hypothetical protein
MALPARLISPRSSGAEAATNTACVADGVENRHADRRPISERSAPVQRRTLTLVPRTLLTALLRVLAARDDVTTPLKGRSGYKSCSPKITSSIRSEVGGEIT